MFRKIGVLLLIFVMIFTLGACGTRRGETQENGNGNGDVIVDPDPQEEREVEATVYFVSNEYIMTGSGEMLIPILRPVTVGKQSLEEGLMAELQKMPEEPEVITMLKDIKVLSVETQDDIAYVNLSSEGLTTVGGSLTEVATITQIVYTLTEIEGIERVQILVDGSKKESLMGHISIDEPLGRN